MVKTDSPLSSSALAPKIRIKSMLLYSACLVDQWDDQVRMRAVIFFQCFLAGTLSSVKLS